MIEDYLKGPTALYLHICNKAEYTSMVNLDSLLITHEITCVARHLKTKFTDTRTVAQIHNIIIEETGEGSKL